MPARNSRTILLLLCSLVFSHFLDAAERKIKSSVRAVTVFSDRALITRRAQEQLPAGEHTLIFGDLPFALQDQTVKVSGLTEGQGKILDVKIESVFLDTIPEQRIRDLQERLKSLRAEQQTLTDRIIILQTQRLLVDSLRVYYVRDAKTGSVGQRGGFDDWEKMLAFVEKSMTSILARIQDTQQKIVLLREKITAIEQEIRNSQAFSKKSQKSVQVVMRTEKAGSVIVDLSYVMSGASWIPLYEARVQSEAKTIEFTYAAQVRQSTNEDWSGIDLTLSTAQPAAGGAAPSVPPWYVDMARPLPVPMALRSRVQGIQAVQSSAMRFEYGSAGNRLRGAVRDVGGEPLIGANVVVDGTNYGTVTDQNGMYVISGLPNGMYTIRGKYIGHASVTISNVQIGPNFTTVEDLTLEPTSISMDEVVVTGEGGYAMKKSEMPETAFVPEIAEVQTQATSVVFKILSRTNIPSDNESHRVTISVESLPVEFSYQAAPKYSPSAFLTAKSKNSTEYPFLSGPMNVFFENNFVATSRLRTIAPNEEFQAGLGIDEGIKIDRKLTNKFTEYTGTFTSKKKIIYDYLIKLENTKKSKVELTLQDQVPISRNEKIVVEVTNPSEKELKPDQSGILTWKLALNPSEKKEIKLKFSIEFPGDMNVMGLE